MDIPSRTRESDAKTGPSRDPAPPSPEQVDGMIAGPLDGKRERRRTAPPPPADPTRDEKNEANAIVASLRAAQHELDAGIASPDPGDRASASVIHLIHAKDAAELYRRGEKVLDVEHTADAFAVSLADFLLLAAIDEVAAREIESANRELRTTLGLPASASKPAGYRKELKADVAYVRDAIPPAFDLIATRTSDLLRVLEQSTPKDDRDAIASDGARRIANHVDYVVWLLESLDTPELRRSYRAHAQQAADRILRTVSWVLDRPANAGLEATLQTITTTFDVVLGLVGSEPLAMHDMAPVRLGEFVEATNEKSILHDAEMNFYGALDDLKTYKIAGVDLASKLIERKDSPDPSFVESLFSAVLVATIGHLGGRIAGMLLRKEHRESANPTGEKIGGEGLVGLLADVTTDSIQSIASASVAGSKNKPEAPQPARALFLHGLRLEASGFTTTYREKISTRIKQRDISANEIAAETAHLKSLIREDEVKNMFCSEAARGWASYVAQSQLGLNVSASFAGKRLANLDGFFDYLREWNTPKPDHHGVLDVRIDIVDDPPRLGVEVESVKPEVRVRSIRVDGFGDDATKTILDNHPTLDRVPLPKKIVVRMIRGIWILEGAMAVDEDGIVRDVWNWGGNAMTRGRSYDDPHGFWATIRELKVAP